jgi:hypothetical protein
MRKSKFRDEPIAYVSRQAESGTAPAEIPGTSARVQWPASWVPLCRKDRRDRVRSRQ